MQRVLITILVILGMLSAPITVFATQSSPSKKLPTSSSMIPPKNFLPPINPPIAPRKRIEITMHGDTRIDDYAWLRDQQPNNVTEKPILAYLKAEIAYTKAFFDRLKPLQEKLYQELRGRFIENTYTSSIKYGSYFYFSRTEKGKNYPIHYRKKEGRKEGRK